MIELKNDKKLRTKIVIVIISLCIILTSIFVLSFNGNYKDFVDNVDNFCENWNGLIKELDDKYPDEFMVEVKGQLLAINLEHISEIYDQSNDRTKLNKYLESNIDQYTFHQAINHIKLQFGDLYKYSDALYAFYTNPTPFEGLEISNIEFYQGTDGYIHCRCSVTNNGVRAQRNMQATVYFRDEKGNVLDYDRYGLVGSDELEVGKTNDLDFNSYIRDSIVSCDMIIDYQ